MIDYSLLNKSHVFFNILMISAFIIEMKNTGKYANVHCSNVDVVGTAEK